MELDATLPPRKDNDKKQKCQREKLCFNCEKPGHMARQCPEKQGKRLHATKEPQKVEYLRATRKSNEESEEDRGTQIVRTGIEMIHRCQWKEE
ncbi:hypothetical protein I7I53_10962 [Histoplasma capsulatum var. duboisii H88]|uniref:CCHC-type domain-containing protein n=1 Tax=Ajellomyces capsulatus (strain H88) TaxID=544711 RepID=A0A8A1L7D3_AJEC8|nr:hypothetical protein I7I53_10962 [Histoplasma capsulatum var. duboisii H88]